MNTGIIQIQPLLEDKRQFLYSESRAPVCFGAFAGCIQRFETQNISQMNFKKHQERAEGYTGIWPCYS